MKTSEKRKPFTSDEETLLLNQLSCDEELRVIVRFLMNCSSTDIMWVRSALISLGMTSVRCSNEVCKREFFNLNV